MDVDALAAGLAPRLTGLKLTNLEALLYPGVPLTVRVGCSPDKVRDAGHRRAARGLHGLIKARVLPVRQLLKAQKRISVAVVVPVVVGRLPIAEQQGLAGRPVPLVLGDVVLGVRKDASKPLEAFCLKVAEFRIGLTKDNAPPFFTVSCPDKLSKVHEQSVSLAATTVSLEKHLKERAGKKVRL